MDNGNAQMYVEDRTEAPGAQPSPGLRTASNRAGEPTISEVSQAVFPDAEAMDSGPQPSPALGGPETGPGHRAVSEEGFPQLSPQEQKPPAGPGMKVPSWVPQEGPRELQADRDPPTPGEFSIKGSDPEGQPIPGHLAANESDTVQPTEPYCTLDNSEQQLRDKLPKEVDTPPIGPQGALPEPGPGGHEDRSQEVESLMPTATLEGKTAHTAPPPTPPPDTPKAR
nr:spermatogenesis-associated protein 21-like isoform X3 [Odocoileus virginianus texanus]